MQLTAEGRFLEAAALLGSVTNMAEICARLCPSDRLCEHACLLDSVSESVSIRALEQFLMEYAFAHGQTDTATPPPNGLKVAVVGSGPEGLACAEELARLGYAVTIFDSAQVPGGLLVNGVPAFRLDQTIVQRRIDLLRKRGVVFRPGLRIWEDVHLNDLKSAHNAVFLCMDWRKARPLEMAGADLEGVVQAVPFLIQKTTALAVEMPPFNVAGKRVIVLGGGDTAMDCLRTAIRYGASEAVCVYRREQAEMPCSRHEHKSALEEGARFVFRSAPVAVVDNGKGQVAALRAVRTEAGPLDAAGRQSFSLRSGTEFLIEADWIITALGFDTLACPRTGGLGVLKVNHWGGIAADDNHMTSMAGVFAGGDLVHGPSPLLQCVRDARQAAAQIHDFLQSSRPATVL
jgi:glutamate synthase (NADPH/NADH) small chain